jgi:hypothetical protein
MIVAGNGCYLPETGHDHEGSLPAPVLATAAGHWALTAAAVTGAVAMALACIGRHRKSSEPAEPRGAVPVPGAGGTLDHG